MAGIQYPRYQNNAASTLAGLRGIGGSYKQAKEGVRQKDVRQQASDFIANEQYADLNKLQIQNPWMKDELTVADKFTSKKIEEKAVGSSSKILWALKSGDSEQAITELENYIDFTVKNGGKGEDAKIAHAEALKGNFEPLQNMSRYMLGTRDLKALEYIESSGGKGTLKPTKDMQEYEYAKSHSFR